MGYSTIAVNTTLSEEYLHPVKKKGKKKEDQTEVKEIPAPPTLNISNAELSKYKVKYLKATKCTSATELC